jgi:Ca2+/Na+ antiporter
VANDTCSCAPGWTGYGDFVFQAPACQINLAAIFVLNSLLLVSAAITFCFALVYLRRSLGRSSLLSKKFGVSSVVTSSFVLIYGCLRMSNVTSRTLGSNVETSVIYFLALVCMTFATIYFCQLLLDIAIRQIELDSAPTRALALQQFRGMKSYQLTLSLAFSTGVFCMPVTMLWAGSRNTMQIMGAVFYVGTSVLALLVWIWLSRSLSAIIKRVEAIPVAEEPRLQRHLAKLKWGLLIYNIWLPWIFILMILVGLLPAATALSSYFVPLNTMGGLFFIGFSMRVDWPESAAVKDGHAAKDLEEGWEERESERRLRMAGRESADASSIVQLM